MSETQLDLVIAGEIPARLQSTLLQFDEIVSWYGTNRPEFRELLQGLHPRCRFLDALPPLSCSLHASDFFLQQVGAPPGSLPRIEVPAVPSRHTVVIHPFSGSAHKNWPHEKFREVAGQAPLPVEWIAGPEERLHHAWRSNDLLQVAKWLKGASVYLGNDSGISHLAAAVGVSSIVLFGPTDPRIWAPRGPCVKVMHHEPLSDLPVVEVLKALKELNQRPS